MLDQLDRQRAVSAAAKDAESFYELAASGTDFYFYQALGGDAYEEHYFNPDGVLLFPETRQVYWFDLDYLTVGRTGSRGRRHEPWDLWRNKFAFSFEENRMGVLTYTLLHSQVKRVTPMQPQRAVEVSYLIGERYRKLCEVSAEGEVRPCLDGASLESAWRSHRKMKIGLTLGRSVLMYDVRLAYLQQGLYSFASKTVAIPDQDVAAFSWEKASIGNLCVSSDGTCSIYRERKPRHPLRNVLATCAPGLVSYAHRIFAEPSGPFDARLRRVLRRSLGPVLSRCVAPFEVEAARCPFTVLVPEADAAGVRAIPGHASEGRRPQ